MLGSWGVVVDEFGVVSGQGDDEEGANVTNGKMLLEGSILEYDLRCVAKTPGKILTTYRHAGGGRPYADSKEILCWK